MALDNASFNMELGRLAHKLFEAHAQGDAGVEARNMEEEDVFEELVERGIAVRLNDLDFALAPEYK